MFITSHETSVSTSEMNKHNSIVNPDKFKDMDKTMKIKLNSIEEKCRSMPETYWNKMVPSGKAWSYDNIHYCIVPKVGCTHWKRILLFISHDYPKGSKITAPGDIDRHFVHFESHPSVKQTYMSDTCIRKVMTHKSFMFTRDPWARLWSAYIDKFLLPDFWEIGEYMVKAIKQNPSKRELSCVKDLSFQEFLSAVVKIWPRRLNEHMEPITSLCSPCLVQYAAIGQMENFEDDSDYILSKFGIFFHQNSSTRRDVAVQEITTLTRYNFEKESTMSADCFNKKLVAQRLWKAFQFNGYIDRLTPFPQKEFKVSDFWQHPKKTFLNIILRTLEEQTTDIRTQKRDMMFEAYNEVSKDVINRLKTVYKHDFDLFGYDNDLFS
ncbi:hypothetical protein ACF0H5_019384 [Mactra antiquata]